MAVYIIFSYLFQLGVIMGMQEDKEPSDVTTVQKIGVFLFSPFSFPISLGFIFYEKFK